MADSQAKPAAASRVPACSRGRTPVRGRRRELAWAPAMMAMPIGRKARPARRAL